MNSLNEVHRVMGICEMGCVRWVLMRQCMFKVIIISGSSMVAQLSRKYRKIDTSMSMLQEKIKKNE